MPLRKENTTYIPLNNEVRKEGISTVKDPSRSYVQECPKMKSKDLGSHHKMNKCCNRLNALSKEK